MALLRAMYPHTHTDDVATFLGRRPVTVSAQANAHGIHKTAEYLASVAAGRIQRGRNDPRMLATQFKKGLVPWNKGTHYVAGGRSALTRFKKGARNGVAAKRWVPIGTLRINGDGYLDRKVTDEGRGPRDWEAVHRLVWKELVGPIPAGSIVVFKPGRRTAVLEEITPERLECITRADHARRNHPRNKSPELARLVQLKGAITRQVNRIVKEATEVTA